MFTGMYILMCTTNQRRYVGSSRRNIPERLKNHFSQLERGVHYNKALQKDFISFGRSSFIIEVICWCLPKEAFQEEQKQLDFWRSQKLCYNFFESAAHASQGMHFYKHTPEAKEAIRKSLLGNKRSLGFKQSQETKDKKAAKLRGQKRSVEFVERHRIISIIRESKVSPEEKFRRASARGRRAAELGVHRRPEMRALYRAQALAAWQPGGALYSRKPRGPNRKKGLL